jgi:hypothetical protein
MGGRGRATGHSSEKDANEARRLQSFAQYWTRLADTEEWQRDHEPA